MDGASLSQQFAVPSPEDSLAICIFKPCPLLSALSHRICITNTSAQNFSLLGPLKKWLYCIHATHWIGEPEPERVSSRIYGINADWQPFFLGLEAIIV